MCPKLHKLEPRTQGLSEKIPRNLIKKLEITNKEIDPNEEKHQTHRLIVKRTEKKYADNNEEVIEDVGNAENSRKKCCLVCTSWDQDCKRRSQDPQYEKNK